MIVFHSWQQREMVIQCGKKHGFKKAYPLYFIKKSSPQALKANMRIVGAVEEATVLYRDKLPKFNNNGASDDGIRQIKKTLSKRSWYSRGQIVQSIDIKPF